MKRATRVLISLLMAGIFSVAALPANARSAARKSQTSSSSTSTKKKSTSRKKRSRSKKFVPKQTAPTADRITQIQTALQQGGYYQGSPSGKWDSNTVAAMQKFQSANGIDATGKLDAPSLQKLGLGSDIAGVSAPKPPATSTQPSTSTPTGTSTPATTAAVAPSAGDLAGKSSR